MAQALDMVRVTCYGQTKMWERGNIDDCSGPLSIGEDADLSHEFLLATTVRNI